MTDRGWAARRPDGTPVGELLLRNHTVTALRAGGVLTLGELRAMGDRELLRLRGIGRAALVDVRHLVPPPGGSVGEEVTIAGRAFTLGAVYGPRQRAGFGRRYAPRRLLGHDPDSKQAAGRPGRGRAGALGQVAGHGRGGVGGLGERAGRGGRRAMRSDVVTAARTQAERQAAARRLLRQAAGRLEVTGGRVAVCDPDLARALLPLKAEVRELLAGLRCVACGEPLGEQARAPAEVGFVHKWSCAGPARRPRATPT